MKAAVVNTLGHAPVYGNFSLPNELGKHQVIADVLAVGLHPRVRSQADGSHYTSTGELPLVPGMDGVARLADGSLRYFILGDSALGSMAERTVVDLRRSVELPADTDVVQIAAAMNPAMSSWIALRHRVDFLPGQRVMIMGATGSAGRLAVQVARLLGAGRVTAVGRGSSRLATVGADATVDLSAEPAVVAAGLAEAGSTVDVVIDYLWGQPTADALRAIVPARADDSQRLRWIQIGSVAGAESAIPSAALRATNLHIVGSGQGSVSTADIVTELAELAAAVNSGSFKLDVKQVPLAQVEGTWSEASSERIVILPNPIN